MKKIPLIFLLFISFNCFAQFGNDYKCGTWKPDSLKITKWVTIDTLKKPVKTDKRNWVENEPYFENRGLMTVNAVYSPCGSGNPYIKLQERVCTITGIRQRRMYIWGFTYVPIEETKYEKTIDSLNKIKKP